MRKFLLIVFKPYTIVLINILLYVWFILSACVSFYLLKSGIWALLLFLLLLVLGVVAILYLAFGKLEVRIISDRIFFKWYWRSVFGYKDIPSLRIASIRKILVKRQEFLRGIITENEKINIFTSKIRKYEAIKFVNYMRHYHNVEIVELTDKRKSHVGLLLFLDMVLAVVNVWLIMRLVRNFDVLIAFFTLGTIILFAMFSPKNS